MNKESVRQILDDQADPIDVDAFLERLVLQQKLERGEEDITAGKVLPHDEAKKRLGPWLG